MAKKKREFGDPYSVKLDTSDAEAKLSQQLQDQNKQQFNKPKRQAIIEFDENLSQNTWDRNQVYQDLLKQNPHLNSDAKKQLKDWVQNHEFTADEISDIANGTFNRKVIQEITEKQVKRATTKEEQEAYRKQYEQNLDNSLKQLQYEQALQKVEEAKNYKKTSEHASSFQEAMALRAAELGLEETDIKKLASKKEFADIINNWKGSKSYSDFRKGVNSSINKQMQLWAAGMVAAPLIGGAALEAAPFIASASGGITNGVLNFSNKYPLAYKFIKGLVGSQLINQGYNTVADTLNWHDKYRDYADGAVSALSNLTFGNSLSNLYYTGGLLGLNLTDSYSRNEEGTDGIPDYIKYGVATGAASRGNTTPWLNSLKYQWIGKTLPSFTAATTTGATLYALDNKLGLPYEDIWKPAAGQLFNWYINPRIQNYMDRHTFNLVAGMNATTQGDAGHALHEMLWRLHPVRAWQGKTLPVRNQFINYLADETPYSYNYTGLYSNPATTNGQGSQVTPRLRGGSVQYTDFQKTLGKLSGTRMPSRQGGGYSIAQTPQQYVEGLNNMYNGGGVRSQKGMIVLDDENVVQINPEDHMLTERMFFSENPAKQFAILSLQESKRFSPNKPTNVQIQKNGYENIIDKIDNRWSIVDLESGTETSLTPENLLKFRISDRRDQAGQRVVTNFSTSKIDRAQRTNKKRFEEGKPVKVYSLSDLASNYQMFTNTNGQHAVIIKSPEGEMYTLFQDNQGSGKLQGLENGLISYTKSTIKGLSDSGMSPETTISIKPFEEADLRLRVPNYATEQQSIETKQEIKRRIILLRIYQDALAVTKAGKYTKRSLDQIKYIQDTSPETYKKLLDSGKIDLSKF